MDNNTTIFSVKKVDLDVWQPTFRFSVDCKNAEYYHRVSVFNGNIEVIRLLDGARFPVGTTERNVTIDVSQMSSLSSLLSEFPTSNSIILKLRVETFEEYTPPRTYFDQVGNAFEKIFAGAVSEEFSAPEFSEFYFQDLEPNATVITGYEDVDDPPTIIQNLSSLDIRTGAASSKNGSYLQAFRINFGDQEFYYDFPSDTSSSPANFHINFGTVLYTNQDNGEEGHEYSDTEKIYVTAIDSRGFKTTISKETNSIWNVSPIIDDLEVKFDSSNSFEFEISGHYPTMVIGGSQKTRMSTAQFSYREEGGSTWYDIDYTSSDITDNSGNFSIEKGYVYVQSHRPDSRQNYEIKITLSKTVYPNDTVFEDILYASVPIVSVDGRHIGINKSNPAADLDVNGLIMMNGKYVMGYIRQLGNESLDSLRSNGIYIQSNGTYASTSNGYPVGDSPGYLEVMGSTTQTLQRYTQHLYAGTAQERWKIFIRSYSGSSWTNWYSIN